MPVVVLLGPKGPRKAKWFSLICNILLLFPFLSLITFKTTVSASVQSPKSRLEQMVVGAPIPDTTTTFGPDGDATPEVDPEPVSQLRPADRFRRIIMEEVQENKGAEPADFELPAALHPIKKSIPRRKPSTKGSAAKVAAAVLPSAALFSQVVLGTKMKERVLGDKATPMPSSRAFDSESSSFLCFWFLFTIYCRS